MSITAVFTAYGLSPADFQVIVTLRRAGEPFRMPQARLMDALELTSGTVSVRLDRLEKNEIVVREPDPDNSRSTQVRLTAKGIALFDAAAPEHLANEERLLSALSVSERQQLADLLRRLLSSYESSHTTVASHLGIRLEPAPVARRRRVAVGLSDTPGLLITTVEPNSVASAAGLARGDLIVRIGATQTLNTVTLVDILDGIADGQRVRVTVLRGDDRKTLTMTAKAIPSTPSATGTKKRRSHP